MQQTLLDVSTSGSTDDVTLDTLTVQQCRHLPINHPLSALLFESPSASLRRPAVLIDYAMCVLTNAASMYGVGYLIWCHLSPTPPPPSTSHYLPVPILNPFASQLSRHSLLVDNVITTLLLTTGLTLIHGTIMQVLVSGGKRPLVHPAVVGRPLSYVTVWQYRSILWRLLCVLTQYGAPCALLSLLFCCGLCGAVGGGWNECAVDANTAVWLKVAWSVPYVILLYPLVLTAATNVRNLSDKRLQRYIEAVRQQQGEGGEQTTVQ